MASCTTLRFPLTDSGLYEARLPRELASKPASRTSLDAVTADIVLCTLCMTAVLARKLSRRG